MRSTPFVTAALAGLLGTFAAVHGAAADESRAADLVVEVRAEPGIPPSIVAGANVLVEHLYSHFGVRLEMGGDSAAAAKAGKASRLIRIKRSAGSDAQGALSGDHVLGTAPRTTDAPGHMAYIFYDAVLSVARRQGLAPGGLLGYAMAHELGHLLLPPGHSDMGIMRADWHKGALLQVRARTLMMGDHEAGVIRDCLSLFNEGEVAVPH